MVQVEVTNQLKGDLGELYFKHLCQHRKYAWIKLEEIHKTPRLGVLEFKHGFDRIRVEIPKEIENEVWNISEPTYVDVNNPSYVFDFLTCQLHKSYSLDHVNRKEPDEFRWVEIKTGNSQLSPHQIRMLQECKIRFCEFRIEDVMVSPDYINILWEI